MGRFSGPNTFWRLQAWQGKEGLIDFTGNNTQTLQSISNEPTKSAGSCSCINDFTSKEGISYLVMSVIGELFPTCVLTWIRTRSSMKAGITLFSIFNVSSKFQRQINSIMIWGHVRSTYQSSKFFLPVTSIKTCVELPPLQNRKTSSVSVSNGVVQAAELVPVLALVVPNKNMSAIMSVFI